MVFHIAVYEYDKNNTINRDYLEQNYSLLTYIT